MSVHRFYLPSCILTGPGCLKYIGPELTSMGHEKALIVTDRSLIEFGIVGRVTDVLEANGLDFIVFDGVQPNPTVDNIEAGIALYLDYGCDFIVTIGGGSAHDCGKAIGVVVAGGGVPQDYFGVDKCTKAPPSLVAINTTAGTASEVTHVAVVTDPATKRKYPIRDKHTMATLAVDDPELMTSLPKGLTAGTGMDALTHAIESYISKPASILTDELAIAAIKLVFSSLCTAVNDGANMDGRDAMVYAQLMAGMSFGNASCGIVHAMSHQLSGQYDLPHGLCNAILLPYCMEYNRKDPGVKAKFASLAYSIVPERARGLGEEAASSLIVTLIRELSEDVGTAKSLSSLGVKEEHIPLMAANALSEGTMKQNPVFPSLEEVCDIYRQAM